VTGETWEKLGVTGPEGGLPSYQPQRQSAARLALRPKRSKLARYVDILRVLNDSGPQKRTHILYKANLSWSDLGDTLRTMEEAGTLRRSESDRRTYYEITEKGRRFLVGFDHNQPIT
jgi:predicted transcriptional regulator